MNASEDGNAAGERVVRYWIWPVAREWKHKKSWVVARAVVLAFGLGLIFWTWGRPTAGGFEWGVQTAITLVYVWAVWVMFGPLRVKRTV